MKIRNLRVENQFYFNERNQLWFFLAFKISFSLSKLTFFQSNNRKIFTTQNLDFFGHYFYLFTAFFGIPLRSVCIHQRTVSENLSMTCFNPNKKFLIWKSSCSKQAETRRMRYGIELITSKWEKRRKKGRFCSLWCPKLSKNMWEIHVSKIYWNQLSAQSWQILENFSKKWVIPGYECAKWIFQKHIL